MSDGNNKICRLCLKTICDNKFDIIEEITRQMLNALLLNVNLDERKQGVMCPGCATKLQNAIDFKTACLNRENKISPFSTSEENMKQNNLKESTILELIDERICRFCMKVLEMGCYTSLQNMAECGLIVNMVQKYIPELVEDDHTIDSERTKNINTTSHTSGTLNSSSTLNKFTYSNVTDAEIYWCLNICFSNLSYNLCSVIIPIFKKMFPDSEIAQKMSLGYTKATYITLFGFVPYFKNNLEENLLNCEDYAICFDESLNKIVQKSQMDIHVRYFDCNKGRVETRFFNSVFMSHTAAEDILQHFLNGIKPLQPNRILQISMDGPNVNWKILKLFKESQIITTKKNIVIGSCGLHIIHGAFQTGHKASKWNINEVLRGIYNLFKDAPKRRSDFTLITKCKEFSKNFAQPDGLRVPMLQIEHWKLLML
ncbi:hypothetical protein NQ314_002598 [Rhamnusium bicolor]|uniref:ZAD domain-containing protein n=1 Tax=Rhamnusium bicolor TaxID=1586634 RepID=A0AAV8ZS73_9CUCU|nr:hypothetical protein NQ314_002598 [Rhamnusium bicolor]